MSNLYRLKQVLDAAWQAKEAELRDILQQEGDVRRSLSDLDSRQRSVRTLPADQLTAPRAIGADILWQGWTQRKRQDLNVQLAQVLVRKAEKLDTLRYAFGRTQAVAAILEQQKTARRKDAQGRDLANGQNLALLRSAKLSGGQYR